jgi:hypothetical protein
VKTRKDIEEEHNADIYGAGIFLTMVCLSLLVVCVWGMIDSSIEGKKEKRFLENNKCVQISEVETGGHVYCGKACFRPEVKHTYKCAFDGNVIIIK